MCLLLPGGSFRRVGDKAFASMHDVEGESSSRPTKRAHKWCKDEKSFLSTGSVGHALVRCKFGFIVGLRNCEMGRSQISQPFKICTMESSGLPMVVIFSKIFATCFANYGRPDIHVAVNNSIRFSTLCWNVRSEAPYSWTPLVRRKLPPRSRRHLGDGSTFEVKIYSRTRCVGEGLSTTPHRRITIHHRGSMGEIPQEDNGSF